MPYSEKLIDHYENPRNVGTLDQSDESVGTGMVGAPACGDVMRLQIKVNKEGVIEDAKFKTYGCGSAIASSSLVTEWVKGKTVEEMSITFGAELEFKAQCTDVAKSLLAMSKGIVVVGGGEPESYALLKEDKLRPIINVVPTRESVIEQLEWIIRHPHLLNQLKADSIAYVKKHHDYRKVAQAYEAMYERVLKG